MLLGATLCVVEIPVHSFSFYVYAETWNECLLKVGRIPAIFRKLGSEAGLFGFSFLKLYTLFISHIVYYLLCAAKSYL